MRLWTCLQLLLVELWVLHDVNTILCWSHFDLNSVLQMCSQEAVLCPGGALSTVWGAGSWSEKPLAVPGPAGRGEGAGQLAGAGPYRHWDPAVAEQRRREGKTCWKQEEQGLIPGPVCVEFAFSPHIFSGFLDPNTFRSHRLETLNLIFRFFSVFKA